MFAQGVSEFEILIWQPLLCQVVPGEALNKTDIDRRTMHRDPKGIVRIGCVGCSLSRLGGTDQ